MARRLLGPDNAAYVFDVENSSGSQQEQVLFEDSIETSLIWPYLSIKKIS